LVGGFWWSVVWVGGREKPRRGRTLRRKTAPWSAYIDVGVFAKNDYPLEPLKPGSKKKRLSLQVSLFFFFVLEFVHQLVQVSLHGCDGVIEGSCKLWAEV
jgi:hypothetical protein